MHVNSWFERNDYKKRRFKELYGRKPTKDEIKLLRKNMIDLGFVVGANHDNMTNIAEKISVKKSGGVFEFGVFQGHSLRLFKYADPTRKLVGFDSFKG